MAAGFLRQSALNFFLLKSKVALEESQTENVLKI